MRWLRFLEHCKIELSSLPVYPPSDCELQHVIFPDDTIANFFYLLHLNFSGSNPEVTEKCQNDHQLPSLHINYNECMSQDVLKLPLYRLFVVKLDWASDIRLISSKLPFMKRDHQGSDQLYFFSISLKWSQWWRYVDADFWCNQNLTKSWRLFFIVLSDRVWAFGCEGRRY